MKKILMAAVAALSMMTIMTGCEKLPDAGKMKTISTVIGRTAGYACELAKTKSEVKAAIMQVLDISQKVVPEEGKTFTETWAPVIATELQNLVNAGKINASEAKIAEFALTTASQGIDYIFVKYPKAKDVKELVSVAVEGFIDGYKSVVTLAANAAKPEIDEDAFKYLQSKMVK